MALAYVYVQLGFRALNLLGEFQQALLTTPQKLKVKKHFCELWVAGMGGTYRVGFPVCLIQSGSSTFLNPSLCGPEVHRAQPAAGSVSWDRSC